jgi:hypothetical protein
LIPDSIQQKYAQTVVPTRIVPGCVQFLGAEKRFYTVWVTLGHRDLSDGGPFYSKEQTFSDHSDMSAISGHSELAIKQTLM